MDAGRGKPVIDSEIEEECFMLDEGWWSSLLAEEVKSTRSHSGEEIKNARTSTGVDWEIIKGFYERDEVICLQVQGFNRGGLLVQGEHLQGFVPISHLLEVPTVIEDEKKEKTLKAFVGKTLELKVIECNPTLERVVLSQRAAQAGEGCRKRIFRELERGGIASGIVTNITNFGVFVDLGGVEGLIHVSELSWGRVRHPREVLSVGDRVEAIVLEISEEEERVALSYKRQFYNPWDDILDHYAPGDIVPATITSITRYGAFARIKEGIEGLIHVSTMSLNGSQTSIRDIINSGQEVTVNILHIDVERRRLGLGLMEE